MGTCEHLSETQGVGFKNFTFSLHKKLATVDLLVDPT